MSGKRLLLTGATGILGGWVLREALLRGFEPVVLLRDASHRHAQERLRGVLSLTGQESLIDEVEVVLGDVRKPRLGLSLAQLDTLREEVDLLIHCAASVSFSARQGEHTWDTNVNGLMHVLGFLAATNIPLYHVSTAYVAGTRTESCLEGELDAGQDFHNAYERSKFECEKIMREAFVSGMVRGAVLRPSIIVGAAEHGRISTFYNFYGFLRLIDTALSGQLEYRGAIRLPLNGECTKNLIPVDWCARAMLEIIETDGPSGLTYHLTNPSPAKQGDLVAFANTLLASRGIQIALDEGLHEDTATPVEKITTYLLEHYGEYLGQEPQFDRSNAARVLDASVPFPEMGEAFYLQLLEYARSQEWQNLMDRIQDRALNEPHPVRQASETIVGAEVAGNAVF
jgi:nucleoside-diphosphate-sugar epimerase